MSNEIIENLGPLAALQFPEAWWLMPVVMLKLTTGVFIYPQKLDRILMAYYPINIWMNPTRPKSIY
ncbi:MAG: hypothetical protein QNL62_14935 [Gammaproteobacteria bacterium]|nr:hypothetical protein [Gammaproteobacteria bacterium]